MNPYNFALLFFTFCTFLLALLIWLRRLDHVGLQYFIFSCIVTLWGIGISCELSPTFTYETTLTLTRFGNTAALFIPVTWIHFILALLDMERAKRNLLISLYVLTVGYSFLGFSPWFITELRPTVGFKYYARVGIAYHLFTFMFFTIVPYGFYLLLRQARRVSQSERKQLMGFAFATLFGFIGGAFTFPPAYNIMLPQHGLFLMPLYPFIMAYFMMRHRLFDVEAIAQAFQKEKLATIGLLAASINHEIRNPLYIAKGTLETFIENEKEGLPHKSPLEASEKTLSAVNRALDVIGKLNRFARPSSEESSHPSASIPQAVETVLDLVSHEFALEKIKITNQIPNDLPSVSIDQRHLEETLFNLIVNACQAMPEGGELILTSKVQTKTLMLSIQDTGTGMNREHLKHLFEPFRTTKGDKGTGLGLYITKQLVERNGGKISVHSQEGKGTVFRLEFKQSFPKDTR